MRGRARGTDFALSVPACVSRRSFDHCVAGRRLWRLGGGGGGIRSALGFRRIVRHHRLVRVLGSLRSGHAAHLLDRHHARRVEQHPGRVSRHRDPDRQGQRLRRRSTRSRSTWAARRSPTPRSSCTASRPGCRRSCSTAPRRRCSSTSRSTRRDPKGNFHGVEQAGVRHAARRLDLHARSARAHLVAAGRGSGRRAPPARASRSTAATTACYVAEEDVGQRARHRRLLPRQRRRRSVEGRRAARDEQDARPRPPGERSGTPRTSPPSRRSSTSTALADGHGRARR